MEMFMPNFFVPFADSPEQAEREYAAFQRPNYPPAHPTARLYKIRFRQDSYDCVATVGEEMTGWPDQHGPVLAIIESTKLIFIHRQRSRLTGAIVMVGFNNVTAREYFDDYPRT
jgi:hypothetical protein